MNILKGLISNAFRQGDRNSLYHFFTGESSCNSVNSALNDSDCFNITLIKNTFDYIG
jgi:hypothetical protein